MGSTSRAEKSVVSREEGDRKRGSRLTIRMELIIDCFRLLDGNLARDDRRLVGDKRELPSDEAFSAAYDWRITNQSSAELVGGSDLLSPPDESYGHLPETELDLCER